MFPELVNFIFVCKQTEETEFKKNKNIFHQRRKFDCFAICVFQVYFWFDLLTIMSCEIQVNAIVEGLQEIQAFFGLGAIAGKFFV